MTEHHHIRRVPKNVGEIHTIDDIAEDLRYVTSGFPEAAVLSALNKQAEITPILLSFLDEVIENYESMSDQYSGHLHALFLLAKFRERQAFSRAIQILSLPGAWSDAMLGDLIMEDMNRIVASLYDGNLAAIHAVIENPDLIVWSRDCALETLLTLVREKVLERSEVISYFGGLFDHPSFKNDGEAMSWLIGASCELYPDELQDQIKTAFKEWGEYLVIDWSFVKSVLSMPKEKALEENLCCEKYSFIDDVVGSLQHWPCFSEDIKIPAEDDVRFENSDIKLRHPTEGAPHSGTPKIGRNDPCPCGSGKKYKKCCLSL